MLHNISFLASLIIFSVALLGMVSASDASIFGSEKTEEFRETYPVKSGAKLDVSNSNGKIEITSWDKEKMEVYAIKKTKESEDEFEKVEINVEVDDDISIKTIFKEKAKVSVSYEIKVPKGVLIDDIETSNGKIILEDVAGDAKLSTSNGKIIVEKLDGSLDASTSNGKIIATSIKGKVEATSSNGKIEVHDCEKIGNLSTSNGKIVAEINELDGDAELETSNGKVIIYLSDKVDVKIDAETSNGRIDVDDLGIPLNISKSRKDELVATVGTGKNKLEIDTSNGSVYLYNMKDMESDDD